MNEEVWRLVLAVILIAVCGVSAIQRDTLVKQRKEIALQGAEIYEQNKHIQEQKVIQGVLRQRAKAAEMLLASKHSICKR